MPNTKTFQVKAGKIYFKCSSCQAKRIVGVSSGLRRRLVHCQKCGAVFNCVLNRRLVARNQQSGRVLLYTGGSEAEVDLFDISLNGVGFELDVRRKLKITEGREVQFKCSWNPRLFNHGHYVVRSVKGNRIGVELRN